MKTAPMVVSARYLGDTIAFKNKRQAAIPMKPGNEKHERCWSEGSGTSLISEFPSAAAPTAENPLSNFPGRKLKSSEIDPKKVHLILKKKSDTLATTHHISILACRRNASYHQNA